MEITYHWEGDLSETLWKHLAEIDEECNEMMDRLVGQMAKKEGVTERLKSDDWLCWLQKMNSIRSRAEEVVLHDLIYSLWYEVMVIRQTAALKWWSVSALLQWIFCYIEVNDGLCKNHAFRILLQGECPALLTRIGMFC